MSAGKRILTIVASTAIILPSLILAGALALTAPRQPAPLVAMTKHDDAFADMAKHAPELRHYKARDGVTLAYRFYQGAQGGGIAVAVHGSSGSSIAMHAIATRLMSDGVSVYAVDLRGHGESGQLGQASYIGQLEDDLEDLVKEIAKAHPAEKRTLVGHSLGGAFALKVAGGRKSELFGRYLALAPFMGASTPMNRPGSGGWADASIPRFVALGILNSVGVTAFNHLPVVAYAVPSDAKAKRAATNSYALYMSASLGRDWKTSIARIKKPATIVVGEKDELFVAAAYPSAIGNVSPGVKVEILKDVGHMNLVTDPEPIARVSEIIRK